MANPYVSQSGISVLPGILKTFEYYKNKIPLYLKSSYGFIDMFNVFYDVLIGLTDALEAMLFRNAVYDEHYIDFIASLEGSGASASDPYGTVSSILDEFAEMFGLRRIMTVEYGGSKYELNLNNMELLILIKAEIVKNNYDGTAEQANKFYNTIGFGNVIKAVTTGRAEATVYLYHESSEIPVTDNLKHLFYSGYLTIKSMGIHYSYVIIDPTQLKTFTLDGSSYNFTDGMTWQQWFLSEYNTDELTYNVIPGDIMQFSGNDYMYKAGSSIKEKQSDAIVQDQAYVIQ